VAGVTAYIAVRVLWRLHVIQRWQDRRDLRLTRNLEVAKARQNSLTRAVRSPD